MLGLKLGRHQRGGGGGGGGGDKSNATCAIYNFVCCMTTLVSRSQTAMLWYGAVTWWSGYAGLQSHEPMCTWHTHLVGVVLACFVACLM